MTGGALRNRAPFLPPSPHEVGRGDGGEGQLRGTRASGKLFARLRRGFPLIPAPSPPQAGAKGEKKRSAHSCLFAALCLLAVTACTQTANAPQTAPQSLVLLGENGEPLFTCPAEEGFVFGIRFTHSVALSPVEEWFSVRGGVIHLDKTVYQDFGAGLPHYPEPGQTMTAENGRIVIFGYDRPLPSFTQRVGRIANHALLPPPSCGAGDEIFLKTLAPAGSPVTITLVPQRQSEKP